MVGNMVVKVAFNPEGLSYEERFEKMLLGKLKKCQNRIDDSCITCYNCVKTKMTFINKNFKFFVLQGGYIHNRIKIEKDTNYIE